MGRLPWAELPTVNACLELIYSRESGQTDFRTFHGWKADGFSVEKGAAGFSIWGKPLAAHGTAGADAAPVEAFATAAESEAAAGFSFFPLCYLFSAAQVKDKDGNRPASYRPEPEPTAEEIAAAAIIAAPLAIAEAEEIDANEENPPAGPMAEPDETNPDTLEPHPSDTAGHACRGCYSTAHDGLDKFDQCRDCAEKADEQEEEWTRHALPASAPQFTGELF